MTRGPSVHITKLCVRLGGVQLLSNVSLDVKVGEVHCIVGPNGGGKTTLARALLGQIPYEGRIVFDGRPGFVTGYAPQSLDLDRSLPFTVSDLMAVMNQRRPAFFGRGGNRVAEQDAALERLGLSGKSKRLFGFLSGGERQRLLFAQALVPSPDLLIMDEPTSNMDEAGSRLVESIVQDLRTQGATVIWINHDWDQVRRVADSVTLLQGRVAAHGEAARVYEVLAGELA
jgi:ABC-type Mn2+/Zn2+ transport system ATPase subunit